LSYGRSLGFSIAGQIWLTAFRLVEGLSCVVDGVEKLGWLPWTPASAEQFQPSPLGPVSSIVEIVAGLLVVVGMRMRIACLVIATHLGLGVLVIWMRDPRRFAEYEMIGAEVFFLVVLLVWGPGVVSVDYCWPGLVPRLLGRGKKDQGVSGR